MYGDKLPDSLDIFLHDGKHSITGKQLAKHYGKKRGFQAWDLLVKEYRLLVATKRAELVKKTKKDDSD